MIRLKTCSHKYDFSRDREGKIEIGGGNIKILLQLHRDNYHQYEERKKKGTSFDAGANIVRTK